MEGKGDEIRRGGKGRGDRARRRGCGREERKPEKEEWKRGSEKWRGVATVTKLIRDNFLY